MNAQRREREKADIFRSAAAGIALRVSLALSMPLTVGILAIYFFGFLLFFVDFFWRRFSSHTSRRTNPNDLDRRWTCCSPATTRQFPVRSRASLAFHRPRPELELFL